MAVGIPVAEPNAQQTSDSEQNAEIEEIVVTGSRLKRRDFTSPSPISTINSDTIGFSGQPTLEETLNQTPQVTPDFGRTANSPGNGTSRINLRGLGAGRTLVMLNGRRLAPSGVASIVDVNSLPQVLVERVEIITGGASTAYGSDAIAGVVNFITRDDFDGFGLEASAYATEYGDSNIYDLNATYGHNFSGARGNFTIFGGYLDREGSFAADREFTSVSWADDWNGSIEPSGSDATPAGVSPFPPVDYGNGSASTTFDGNGVPREFVRPQDLYNYQPVNYLQIPLIRYMGGLMLNYDLTSRLRTYLETSLSRNKVTLNAAPVPVLAFVQTNLDNPVLSPEARQVFSDNYIRDPNDPNLVSFGFRRRLEELGPRYTQKTLDSARIVAGLRGELVGGFDFDVWLTYSTFEEDQLQTNGASDSRYRQGLLVDSVTGQCYDPSDGCVALNLFGAGNLSSEGAAFVRSPGIYTATSRTQRMASALLNGSPLDSWAGPVDLAFGVEWRDDTGSFRADDALSTGDVHGYGSKSNVAGSESVIEAYFEALVPLAQGAQLAKTLTVEFGGRYSEYKNAGSVNTYKLGGEWQPFESVRIRTMFQRSVRAPNLLEAFQEQLTMEGSYAGFNSSNDPCSASADPIPNNNADKCAIQGMPASQVGIWEATPQAFTEFISGGNPALVPDTAETFTIGAVLNFPALENWQFSIDYFELEVADTIGDLDASLVCFDQQNTQHQFCSNLQRDPLTYDVSLVYQPTSNRGELRTEGIDTQINFQSGLPKSLSIGSTFANIIVDLIWTHMTTNTIQQHPVATTIDCAGRFGWPCGFVNDGITYPNDRITMNANYVSGDFSTHLTWRWIAATDNAAQIGADILGLGEIDPGAATASAKSYVNLGFGFQFSDNVAARFNVANLLRTSPPMMADAVFSNNTDTAMYDIFGRSYTLSVALRY